MQLFPADEVTCETQTAPPIQLTMGVRREIQGEIYYELVPHDALRHHQQVTTSQTQPRIPLQLVHGVRHEIQGEIYYELVPHDALQQSQQQTDSQTYESFYIYEDAATSGMSQGTGSHIYDSIHVYDNIDISLHAGSSEVNESGEYMDTQV